MLVLKNMVNKKNIDIEDIIPIADCIIFPNHYKLLQAALTIQISSATCERSFSVLRGIKNWIRNSMTSDRFSNLSLLHIERDLSLSLHSENILNILSKIERRLNLI